MPTDWKQKYSPGGVTDGGAIAPYSMRVQDGKLQTLMGASVVAEMSPEGSTFTQSVKTGTGSFHLGELHSMGSGGENVTWVNTDSGYAWFPAWQAMKVDGTAELSATTRVHGATLIGLESAGALGTASVDYNDTFTSSGNVAFFRIETVPAESYTGRLRYRVTKPSGKEIAEFYFDAVAVNGVLMSIPFKYPLWVMNGQTFITKLTKEDGTFFKVKASSTQTTRPYRKSYYRTFVDKAVISEATPIPSARSLETLVGADRLDVLKLKNTEQLATGGFVGAINFAGGMTQFANAQRNQYWQAAEAGSIGTLTFKVGDKLICKANVSGTPSDLSSTTTWAVEANLSAIATAYESGTVMPGDGLSVAANGKTDVKLGAGLKFDALMKVAFDPVNVSVFSLKDQELLNKGNYRGDVPATASGLANAKRGDFWKASVGKSLLGTNFAAGDELYCQVDTVAAPADLASFSYVSGASSAMIGSTATVAGAPGSVPTPPAGKQAWLLSAAAQWVDPSTLGGGVPVATVIEWEGAKYSLPVPSGWWACDGSVINSVGSLLHGQAAPDHRGYVIGGAGGSYVVGSQVGADSYTFQRSNLPNISLSGTSSYTPGGTCSSSTGYPITGYSGSLVQTAVRDYAAGPILGYAGLGSGHHYATTVSTTFTGTAATITTSNISLNGGVTQTAMDMRQRTRYVTKLIKL